MKTFAERLKFAREKKGLTQEELAFRVGMSQSAIGNLESGLRKSSRNTARLATILGVNALWLDIGIGTPANSDVVGNVEPGPDLKTERKYPVISFVQAGNWTEICENFSDTDEWRQSHKDLGPCGYVLRVRGPSMTAPPGENFTFPEGMLLYVNPDIEAVPGQFVIVRRSNTNEATFKKLIKVEGELYLEAINPNWPNRYMKLMEGDIICGVVVTASYDMP